MPESTILDDLVHFLHYLHFNNLCQPLGFQPLNVTRLLIVIISRVNYIILYSRVDSKDATVKMQTNACSKAVHLQFFFARNYKLITIKFLKAISAYYDYFNDCKINTPICS